MTVGPVAGSQSITPLRLDPEPGSSQLSRKPDSNGVDDVVGKTGSPDESGFEPVGDQTKTDSPPKPPFSMQAMMAALYEIAQELRKANDEQRRISGNIKVAKLEESSQKTRDMAVLQKVAADNRILYQTIGAGASIGMAALSTASSAYGAFNEMKGVTSQAGANTKLASVEHSLEQGAQLRDNGSVTNQRAQAHLNENIQDLKAQKVSLMDELGQGKVTEAGAKKFTIAGGFGNALSSSINQLLSAQGEALASTADTSAKQSEADSQLIQAQAEQADINRGDANSRAQYYLQLLQEVRALAQATNESQTAPANLRQNL
jgi:hypothetical protein